jgi:hypothetical protein
MTLKLLRTHFARVHGSIVKQPSVIARILYSAPGPPSSEPDTGIARIRIISATPEKKPRARGTPRGPMDPRASTPRDIEACRSPL